MGAVRVTPTCISPLRWLPIASKQTGNVMIWWADGCLSDRVLSESPDYRGEFGQQAFLMPCQAYNRHCREFGPYTGRQRLNVLL